MVYLQMWLPLAVMSLTNHVISSTNGRCERYIDVAIVGAGPAGAYTAYRLRNENLTVEVFEYFNRVGGRLYTTTLADAPDVPIDLGAMCFWPDFNKRVVQILHETGTPYGASPEGLTAECRQLVNGTDVTNPGQKSIDYKTILRLFLEELTGYNGTDQSPDSVKHLKVSDGRYLYNVTLLEAMDMLGSREMKSAMKSLELLTQISPADSVLTIWIHAYVNNAVLMTPLRGMGSIPTNLIRLFLDASSKHRLTMNRRLMSISSRHNGYYTLVFRHTKTSSFGTTELTSEELVCAKKVILAVPKMAFSQLDWAPVRATNITNALSAVRDVELIKIFLSFPSKWWTSELSRYPNDCLASNQRFTLFTLWAQSKLSGHYVTMASLSSGKNAHFLRGLNVDNGGRFSGLAPGWVKVSGRLMEYLLDELSNAFGVDRGKIPLPIKALSYSWSSYPFGGGWSLWKSGFWFKDVIATLQRPSLSNDIFYIANDFSQGIVENALEYAEQVVQNYFL